MTRNKRVILLGVIAFVVCSVIGFFTNRTYIGLLTTNDSIYNYTDETIKAGDKAYVFNSFALVDKFYEDEKGVYYITPLNTEDKSGSYMAIMIPMAYKAEATIICQEYYRYMTEDVKPSMMIEGKGYVDRLTEEQAEAFISYFKDLGIDDSFISKLSSYKFVYVPSTQYGSFVASDPLRLFGAIIFHLGIVLLFAAIVYVLYNRTRKSVQETEQPL